MPSPVQIAVTPERPSVMPGGKVTCGVVVRNVSGADGRFHMAVAGVPADWYTLDPDAIALAAGATARLSLVINPPRIAGAATTDHLITVEARSVEDPASVGSAQIVLTVSGPSALGMTVSPATVTGRYGRFAVTFTNESDVAVSVSVAARDRGMRLTYSTRPPAVTVPARGSASIQVTAQPLAAATLGTRHDFLIEFTGVRGERQADLASSPLIQEGLFAYKRSALGAAAGLALRGVPLWARLVAALLACAIIAFAGVHTLTAGTASPSTAVSVPTTTGAAARATGTSAGGAAPTATPMPSPTPSPQSPPAVDRLSVRFHAPNTAEVQWAVSGSRTVQIDGKPVRPAGQASFPVSRQGRLLFSASNEAGTVARVLALVAATPSRVMRELPARRLAPPVIVRFMVLPRRATAALSLVWRVRGADEVLLNGIHVPPVSVQPIQIGSVRAYRLQALNAAGQATAALTLPALPPVQTVSAVLHRPEIARFALMHPADGTPYMLIWQTSYASVVRLNGRAVAAVGSLALHAPLRTAEYVLSARNMTGTATAKVQVRVQ